MSTYDEKTFVERGELAELHAQTPGNSLYQWKHC